jgi:hypothetical protein
MATAAGAETTSAATTKTANARRDDKALLTGPASGEQRQSTPDRF